MKIALLATGNEIIYGDIVNTNSQYIAHALNSEGFSLGTQMVCSDKERDIESSLAFLTRHYDTILVIGGLGPTSDDRTRFALANFLQVKLTEFNEAIEHIQTKLKPTHRGLNLGDRQQALFPKNASLLMNPYGTAMGCYYSSGKTIYILLPGPPRECLPMFNHLVLPLLQKKKGLKDAIMVTWRLFGVAESDIADKLETALLGIECKTGYRLDTPYIEFKIRCKEAILPDIKKRVEPLITPLLIATNDKKASELLKETITSMQQTICITDEVTGGLLQTLIQTPENESFLTFNPSKNQTGFHFHLQGLREYWTREPITGETKVSITYTMDDRTGKEEHDLPYRSPLVVHLAAEWLSFRLFQRINGLHQCVT